MARSTLSKRTQADINALLLFDLYWLRYKKPGEQWYEVTDLIRDHLVSQGVKITYDDKNQDIRFNGQSFKKVLNDRLD